MKINSEQMALLKKAIGSWNRENNCILALITDEFLKKDFDTLVELIAENKSDELLSLLIPYAGEETKSFWQDNKWIELSKTDDFIKSYRETPLKDDSVMWTVRAEGGETLFHTLKNDGFKLEILAKISDENKLFGVLNVPSYNASPILHSFNNPNSYFKLFERIKNQEHLEDLICRGRAAFYNTINL
ncbi:MAG: hypothetical protein FWC61_03280, partial [Proteobacteria bacterium]|nr:hypothetical protein [Pseudomonadota bacterium]